MINEAPKYHIIFPNYFDINAINLISLFRNKIDEKISDKYPNYPILNLEAESLHEAPHGKCFSKYGTLIDSSNDEFWEAERFQYKINFKHLIIGDFFIIF